MRTTIQAIANTRASEPNRTENHGKWDMQKYTQHARDNNGDTIYTDFDGIMKIIEQTGLIETFI